MRFPLIPMYNFYAPSDFQILILLNTFDVIRVAEF